MFFVYGTPSFVISFIIIYYIVQWATTEKEHEPDVFNRKSSRYGSNYVKFRKNIYRGNKVLKNDIPTNTLEIFQTSNGSGKKERSDADCWEYTGHSFINIFTGYIAVEDSELFWEIMKAKGMTK